MSLPRHLPDGDSKSGYGPFGKTGFRIGLIMCIAGIAGGLAMVLFGGTSLEAVGASLLTLGALGLVTAGLGLLSERVQGRRPQPRRRVEPRQFDGGNGSGPYSHDAWRLDERFGGR